MTNKIIIGLTGPFGSGCSYIATNILIEEGYKYISLSDILREEISSENSTRSDLQDKGNELRKQKGANYLAKRAIEIINSLEDKKNNR